MTPNSRLVIFQKQETKTLSTVSDHRVSESKVLLIQFLEG